MTSPEGALREVHEAPVSPRPGISLHWKLFGLSSLLVLCALLLLYLLADRTLESRLLEETEAGLLGRASATREALLALGDPADAPDLGALLARLSPSLGARLRVFAEDGTLLGDSMRRGEGSPSGAGEIDIEEINRVIRGDAALVQKRGGKAGTRFMSVTSAFPAPGGEWLVMRLDAPLLMIGDARRSLRNEFLLVTILVLVLLFLAGAVTRRRASYDIESLERAALSFGAGDFTKPVRLARNDELGELARILEATRARLLKVTGEAAGQRDVLQEILDTMEDGVLMTDAEGKVLQINPALRRLFDLPPEPVGRRIIELVRTPELQALIGAGLGSDDARSGEITVTRGGEDRRILVHVSPIRKAGRSGGVVAVFHDVTERRRLEKVRQEFVANASHELKTPLTALRGYAETLAESPPQDPGQARAFVGTILKHARRLGALVDDLLELSRIESGQAVLRREPLAPGPVIERVVHAFGPAAKQRDLKLTISVPERLPPLLGDPVALETILSNLVENAVKYADEGGEVAIRAAHEGEWLRVDVADTGPGIPAVHIPRLFERFYRIDPSRSRELGGTGLGLAIVKHLSQALGGRAEVRSEPGQGSVFTVHLPVAGPGGPPRTG